MEVSRKPAAQQTEKKVDKRKESRVNNRKTTKTMKLLQQTTKAQISI